MKKTSRNQILKVVLKMNTYVGMLLLVLSIVLFLLPSLPQVWYAIYPDATKKEVEKIVSFEVTEPTLTPISPTNASNEPKYDPNLPKTNQVIISEIGVMSPIIEGTDYNKALERGTWIVSDFATPGDSNKPIILASHRFGYISWSLSKRKEISFLNLHKLKPGDTLSIVWDQKEYKYEITHSEESTRISDYKSDLILYTCKLYNSPIRIIKYAKQVN